jgi:hypothetical protein
LDFLTETEARALRDRGTRLVGVYDPSGRHGRGRRPLDELKVETALAITQGPEALLDAVATLTPSRRARDPFDATTAGPDLAVRGNGRTGLGSVVVVGGGSDAPGRTELVIGMAATLAACEEPVLLLDLDRTHPGVARRLGYQLTPNLMDAFVAVDAGASPDGALAQRAGFASGSVRFDAIVSGGRAGDGSANRDPGGLIVDAKARWRWVVVDAGPNPGLDPGPRPRSPSASTAAVLATADQVIAVASPTPLGVLRLLDWIAAVAEPLRDRPCTVVVNRAPRDGFRREELREQITENIPAELVAGVEFVSEDRAVFDAVWEAAPVRGGRFSCDLTALCGRLLPGGRVARSRPRVLWRQR